jgi:hypothetical protein
MGRGASRANVNSAMRRVKICTRGMFTIIVTNGLVFAPGLRLSTYVTVFH